MNKSIRNIEESLKTLNQFNDTSDLNKMIKLYDNTNKLIKKTSNDIDLIEKKLKKEKEKLYKIKDNLELTDFISKFNLIDKKIKSTDDLGKLIDLNSELKKIHNSIIYYMQNKKLEIENIN